MEARNFVSFEIGRAQIQIPVQEVAAKLLEKFSTPLPTAAGTRIGTEMHGGIYVGLARGFNGAPDQSLILLPGTFEGTWDDAVKWAEAQGGSLPTRREAALLFANAHDQFEGKAHWLCEQSEGYSAYAWVQNFNDGDQGSWLKDNQCRARAVRRV
jgi:hypothetical protein